ncbi:MAG: SDR family oxidoreductase, partial [Lentimonas sp.]
MSFLNLSGKRFLVMGVANRKSVAWAITKQLEAEGAEVIHSVRSEARLDTLQKLLDGRKAYLCDVEFPEQITALAEQVAADYGQLDGIVHSIAFANY